MWGLSEHIPNLSQTYVMRTTGDDIGLGQIRDTVVTPVDDTSFGLEISMQPNVPPSTEEELFAMMTCITKQPPFTNTLVYLLLSLPLGIVYFVVVVTGLAMSAGTLIIWLGVPILLIVLLLVRGMAEVERQLIGRLFRWPLPTQLSGPQPKHTFLDRLGILLRDPGTWMMMLYMLLKLPLGIVSFVLALSLPLVALAFTVLPLIYLLNLYIDIILLKNGIHSSSALIPYFIEIHGGFDLTMFLRTFLLIPIGIVFWFLTYFLLQGLGSFSRELAYALLGPGERTSPAVPEESCR